MIQPEPAGDAKKVLAILKDVSPFHFDIRTSERELPDQVHRSMQLAVTEGALTGIMATMIGGVVLTGLALALGANAFMIGLIAAIQAGANLLQMRAYQHLESTGERKKMTVRFAAASRAVWIVIIGLLFLNYESFASARVWIFILLFALSAGLGVMSAVAWVSWMVDLVPQRARGRFFAQRNLAAGAVAVILGIGAGKFIDFWKEEAFGPEPYAFILLLTVGLVFGFWAVAVQNRMYDPPFKKPHTQSTFWEALRRPFSDPVFRKVFTFRIFYDLSLGSAGTFFSVYMLTQMGMSFTFVSAMTMVTTLTNLLSLRFWGRIVDTYGNKPILYICLAGKFVFAILWLFTTPDTFLLFVIIHCFGVFDGGNVVAIPNLVYKIAPAERRANYITVDGTIVGIAATVAPLLGGSLAVLFSGWSLNLGPVTWSHFHFLFIVSIILRFVTFWFLRKVLEPEAAGVTEVISVVRPVRSIDVYKGFELALNVVIAPAKFVVKRISRRRGTKPGKKGSGPTSKK